jgi:hypothetical protein
MQSITFEIVPEGLMTVVRIERGMPSCLLYFSSSS